MLFRLSLDVSIVLNIFIPFKFSNYLTFHITYICIYMHMRVCMYMSVHIYAYICYIVFVCMGMHVIDLA